MKTTVPAHRSTAPVVRVSAIRMAAIVSVGAAVAAVLLRVLTDLPSAAIVLTVAIVAFSVSWHVTWHGRPRTD